MKLSEDWMAVIVGLAVVVLIWIGILGSLPWPLFKF
jgi:hypothetical protein